MDFKQVQLVRDSFEGVQAEADSLMIEFYNRLFILDPTLRRLFTRDLAEQSRKFITMLRLMIEYLDQPFKLHPLLARIGSQHATYGVLPQHYTLVGQVLIETVATAYGPAWNPTLAAAWQAVYYWMAHEMQAGAFVAEQND